MDIATLVYQRMSFYEKEYIMSIWKQMKKLQVPREIQQQVWVMNNESSTGCD